MRTRSLRRIAGFPIINLGSTYIPTGYNASGLYQPDMIHAIGATVTKIMATHPSAWARNSALTRRTL